MMRAQVKRHGEHHFVNVKYGYIVLFATVIYMGYLYVSKLASSPVSSKTRSRINLISLLLWTLLIAVLSFWHFEASEIIVSIKRMGRLSCSLLPLDIFISLKPNPLPNVYYLELIFLHKWISRLVVLLGFLHGLMFTAVWIKSGTLGKILKLWNFIGVVAIALFLLSAVISLKPLRRRLYKLFFTGHLVIAWACVILLQLHARPGVTIYTWINGLLFILQIVTKLYKSTDVTIEKTSKHGSTLDLITLPNAQQNDFIAGSHLRVSTYTKLNPLNFVLPSHPFTISSLPGEQSIALVVRKTSCVFKTGQIVSTFGPFPSIPQSFFSSAGSVVLVAGGSGISYALGLYQQLKASHSNVKLSLMWILRNKADMWILDHFDIGKVDIFLTGGAISADDPVSRLYDDDGEQLLDGRDSLELDDLTPQKEELKTHVKLGRPNFEEYYAEAFRGDETNAWIVSCGTSSLNKDSSVWADKLGVCFHSESYEL